MYNGNCSRFILVSRAPSSQDWADEEPLTFPYGCKPDKDGGFQGYELPGVERLQPKKKPGGQGLSARDKQHTRRLLKLRSVSERVSGRAKIPVSFACF